MNTTLKDTELLFSDITVDSLSTDDVIIQFFGEFSITTAFGILTESEITSTLAIRLIVYLLTYRTRKIPQRELANMLWQNSEVVSPIKQVKNVVHRARKILKPIFPHDLIASDKAGNYFINPNFNIITDTDVFERLLCNDTGHSIVSADSISNLSKAVLIYKNDFLPNRIDDNWLDNQRTYYHLSYIQAMLSLLPLLYEQKAYSEIYNFSRTALLHEPDNGDFHFWNIRAMHILGGHDIAQKHFLQHSPKLSADQKILLNHILFST